MVWVKLLGCGPPGTGLCKPEVVFNGDGWSSCLMPVCRMKQAMDNAKQLMDELEETRGSLSEQAKAKGKMETNMKQLVCVSSNVLGSF